MTSRNNKFSMGGRYRSLLIAAAVLCGASAALTDGDAFTSIDIMETVRQSEVESPFTFSTTGENDGSHSEQLFDLDLNKLLICTDPAKRKWVDALGNECP